MNGDGMKTPSLGSVIGDLKKSGAKAKDPAPKSELQKEMESFYATDTNTLYTNWYKQRPFAFVFTNQKGKKSTFYLPIAPSNININTHFATNVITTMYGTVEEHSEQRYYDITIAGTTAMMPRYYKVAEDQKGDSNNGNIGRASFAVKASLSNAAGGFFKRTLDTIENSINQAKDFLGISDKPTSGIDLKRTGYVAFHNFYKFLLAYKKDTASAGIRKTNTSGKNTTAHPLRFVNYKDNNQYDVSVQQFQLTRDSGDPFLYNYNIVLRAYNLRSADAQDNVPDISDRKQELGLDGIKTSLLTTMANKAAQAKRAAYSAIGAAKGFGS